jgi:hypothetical protein
MRSMLPMMSALTSDEMYSALRAWVSMYPSPMIIRVEPITPSIEKMIYYRIKRQIIIRWN